MSDSALSARYGPGETNYFAGSPLNRVGFLRDDHEFLALALTHASARFVPLFKFDPAIGAGALLFLTYADVEPLVGNPYAVSEAAAAAAFDSDAETPTLVFLGLDEAAPGIAHRGYAGQPYFAVDITPTQPARAAAADAVHALVVARGAAFEVVRVNYVLSPAEAAIYAQARSYVDWNLRNPFCAGCGARTLSVNGGCKRVCPPSDRGVARPPCPSRGVVTNIAFPRSDPTIICAVVNRAGDRLLLGRNKRFPVQFYSCLAGFCEPAESVEEAVRREVWEESGVKLGRVVIHSTQPWPYPASLMIGAIAEAVEETIHLEHDPELGDAQWFPFADVADALHRAEHPESAVAPADGAFQLQVPPSKAIAHVLMRAVVLQKAHLPKL
ncbi:NUDIX hydrolase domain-like protein [Dipodascopsis tothii]|uniref:NUDIX hydrolase domain-like protein n=1 Tax=Dipodascopsis tothii TaxID=44089 RepID=UPI0034CFC5D5